MKDKYGNDIKIGDIIVVAGGLFIVVVERARYIVNGTDLRFLLVHDYDKSIADNQYEYPANVINREAKERRVIGNVEKDDLKKVLANFIHEEVVRMGWDKPKKNSAGITILPIYEPKL